MVLIGGGFFALKTIRRPKLLERQASRQNELQHSVSVTPDPKAFQSQSLPVLAYNGVSFGTVEHPLIEVKPRVGPYEGQMVAVDAKTRTYLEALVQPAIELGRTGNLLATTTYEIVFHPDVQLQLSMGMAEVMSAMDGGYYTTAVNSHGTIIGHGSHHRISGVNPGNLALGVWQIMALVTSQKFLADISYGIGKINRELQEIKCWLQEEQYNQIEGNFRYLKSIASDIAAQRYEEGQVTTFNTQLEAIIRETLQLTASFDKRQMKYRDEISNLKVTGRGYAKHKEEIETKIAETLRFAQYRIATLHLLGIVAQLRCALPVDPNLSSTRLADLAMLCEELSASQTVLKETLNSKIVSLQSTKWNVLNFKKNEMHQNDHLSLSVDLNKKYSEVVSYLEETTDAIKAAQNVLLQRKKLAQGPRRLMVTLNDRQKIQQIQQL